MKTSYLANLGHSGGDQHSGGVSPLRQIRIPSLRQLRQADYNFFEAQQKNDEIGFVEDILSRTSIEGYKHIFQDKKRLQHAIGSELFQ